MGKTVLLLLLPLLMVGVAIIFLQSKTAQKQPTATQSETPLVSPQETTPTTVASETREIKVTGTEFAFSPSNVPVKKGERVKLVFENKGSQTHDWAVEDLNLKTQRIKSNSQDTLEFQTPDKAGSYDIICSVPGHKEAGMTGMLIVE